MPQDLPDLESLYGRYAHALREDDRSGLGGCFTSDALVVAGAADPVRGRDAVVDLLMDLGPGRPRHLITDVHIARDDGTTAQSLAHFTLLSPTTGQILAFGHYEDEARRDASGRWRWSRRVVVLDWASEEYGSSGRLR